MLCRPKNNDGYSISTGVASPAACQDKCDQDASTCGAWEYEYHSGDDRECELHEASVISVASTQATGACQLGDATTYFGYRCCYALTSIVATGCDGERDG